MTRHLRPAAAAAHLGISRTTLYKYLSLRRVPFVKLGRMTLIPIDSLALLLDPVASHAPAGQAVKGGAK